MIVTKIKRVAVFCSSSETRPEYKKLARKLGTRLALEGFDLVFGGGDQGLMGIVADAVSSHGGKVIGITTEHLSGKENKEAHHITEISPNMHVRKQRMFEEADAIVNIAGGFGTMDEMFEAMTLRQIGEMNKPIFFLDISNSFFIEGLKGLMKTMVHAGTIQREDLKAIKMTSSIPTLLKYLHKDRELIYISRYTKEV